MSFLLFRAPHSRLPSRPEGRSGTPKEGGAASQRSPARIFCRCSGPLEASSPLKGLVGHSLTARSSTGVSSWRRQGLKTSCKRHEVMTCASRAPAVLAMQAPDALPGSHRLRPTLVQAGTTSRSLRGLGMAPGLRAWPLPSAGEAAPKLWGHGRSYILGDRLFVSRAS